jgi:hypothetical protein
MSEENKNLILRIGEFEFDIFLCDNGDFGMTIGKHGQCTNDDIPTRDIYVKKESLEVLVM